MNNSALSEASGFVSYGPRGFQRSNSNSGSCELKETFTLYHLGMVLILGGGLGVNLLKPKEHAEILFENEA